MSGPAFVLVHSPFVGGSTWRGVAGALTAFGRRAIAPSLVEALERQPHYPPLAEMVANAARGLDAVVVVLHSAAGGLAHEIVRAASIPVVGVMFVDAVLPHAGRNRLSTLSPGLAERMRDPADDLRIKRWDQWFEPSVLEALIPDATTRAAFIADLPRAPWTFLEEIAPDAAPLPKPSYLRLSPIYEDEARQADRLGWRTLREDRHHLAMVTDPERVAAAILGLIQ